MVVLISYLDKHQKEINIDMKDYLIGGFSAGGHAVGMLLTKHFSFEKYKILKPKLMFLGYGVITMGKYATPGSKLALLGEKPQKKDIEKYSIELGIEKKMCKLYFWQCERDNIVPFENFTLLKDAATKAKLDFRCRSFDSDAYGWGIANNKLADGWIDDMLNFIN